MACVSCTYPDLDKEDRHPKDCECECHPKQKIWRYFKNAGHNGVFVWEVIEVLGEPSLWLVNSVNSPYMLCRDGSYIIVDCFHFFNETHAHTYFQESLFNEQNVILID